MNDLAASVRARLLNVAKAQGANFDQVLVRFALERILYRLTQSEHADLFLLKGALLFTLWYDLPHRSTRDADLLGFGASDLESQVQTFRDIAGIAVDDGIVFDPASVVPEALPIGLTDAFVVDSSRQAIWQAFLRKNDAEPRALADVVAALRMRLEPVLRLATVI